MNFIQLRNELGLDLESKSNNEHQLSKIENWCRANISTHTKFLGTDEEKFRSYLALAQYYLDTFLKNPNVHDASARGFDKYLATVSQSKINEVPTALHSAALAGHVDTTRVLLSKEAKQNKQLQIPIYSALLMPVFFSPDLRKSKIEIYRLLVAKDQGTLNSLDDSGDTILHRMVAQGFFELIQETLEIKPDLLNISNKHVHYPIHTAILNKQKECVEILMKYQGVELQVDAEQQTPLEYAFKCNDQDLIEICVNASTDINRRNSFGETPLLLAARTGNLSVVSTLVDRGADIKLVDFNGNSALHCSVLSGNIDVVSWFLTHSDLDKCHPNTNGQTPIDLCQDDEIKQLLLAHNVTGITTI